MTRYLVACPPDRTAGEAIALGRLLATGADVTLDVCTVSPGTWPFRSKASVDAEYIAFTEQRAAAVLEQARKELGDLPAEYTVLHERRSAATTILARAEEAGDELVVLASTRRRPGRISIGSTADAIMHRSDVPVAIAPEGHAPSEGAAVDRVTVGVSGSKGEQEALSFATGLARERGIPVRVATVLVIDRDAMVPVVGFGPDMAIWTEWRAELDALHAEILERLPRDVEGSSVITQGYSWGEALDELQPREGELFVIGGSGQGLVRQVFLGTHSGKIMRNAAMPVVVVPTSGEA